MQEKGRGNDGLWKSLREKVPPAFPQTLEIERPISTFPPPRRLPVSSIKIQSQKGQTQPTLPYPSGSSFDWKRLARLRRLLQLTNSANSISCTGRYRHRARRRYKRRSVSRIRRRYRCVSVKGEALRDRRRVNHNLRIDEKPQSRNKRSPQLDIRRILFARRMTPP